MNPAKGGASPRREASPRPQKARRRLTNVRIAGARSPIAVLTAKRNPEAPQVPTMTESGVGGLEIDSWIGIFAPAKTPPAVIARLQKEIAAAGPEMKPRLASLGGELMEMAPDQLNGFIRAEYDKWIKIIRDAGIRLD